MPRFVSEINILAITLTENVGVIFSKVEYTLKTYLVDRDTFQQRKGRGYTFIRANYPFAHCGRSFSFLWALLCAYTWQHTPVSRRW